MTTTIEYKQGNIRLLVSKIDPNKEPPSILAHLPWQTEPLNMTNLNNLPSPANLPELGSRHSSFYDNEAEGMYQDVYSGHITLWTHMEQQCEDDGSNRTIIVAYQHQSATPEELSACLDFESLYRQFRKPILIVSFVNKPDSFPENIGAVDAAGTTTTLTEAQMLRLEYRIRHLFLRSHGTYLDANFLTGLTEVLVQAYSQHKMWKDAYELLIGCASTLFFDLGESLSSNNVQHVLYQAGEMLEAGKQFQEASNLYQANTQSLLLQENIDYSDQRIETAWIAAGLASKRGCNLQEAEQLYLKGLHFSFKRTKNWESVDAIATTNMVHLYEDWYRTFTFEEGGMAATRKGIAFMCLLLASKAACNVQVVKHSVRLICSEMDDPLVLLKPRFRFKKPAKEALTKAVAQANNVKQFESVLLECLNPRINVHTRAIPESQESLERRFHQEQKQNARDYVQARTVGNYLQTMCTCCGTVLEKAKQCPCRTAWYCSKKCQTDHWKNGHKHVCPWKKAKDSEQQQM